MKGNGAQPPDPGSMWVAMVLGLVVLTALFMAGCASSGRRLAQGPLCEERPPGKSVGLAIADEPFVCIPSLPNNNNATCIPFEAGLRDRAAVAAAGVCVRVQNLQCIKRECPNDCIPAATITTGTLILDKNFQGCPNPANEDACRFLAVTADCDCVCPEVIN